MIVPNESLQVVSSVFGDAALLDLTGFEHLLRELGMPVGRFMQAHKANEGRSVELDHTISCLRLYVLTFAIFHDFIHSLLRVDTISDGERSLMRRVKSSLRKMFDDNGYQLWTGLKSCFMQ